MRVRFMIVPPDGGEIDHVMFADVPSLPREGDYVSVSQKAGYKIGAFYIVRRVWWHFKDKNQDDDDYGEIDFQDEVCIEVEEAIGAFTEGKVADRMRQNGHKEMEATAY